MTRLSSPEMRIIRTMLIKEFGSAKPRRSLIRSHPSNLIFVI